MRKAIPVTDPETGFIYPSMQQYGAAVGLGHSAISRRKCIGKMSPEMVVFPGNLKNIPAQDHTGRNFESITAMCRFWKIPRRCYTERIRCGWTIKQALTTPPRKYRQLDLVFEGRVFNTYRELASYLHLNEATVKSRLRYGWSLSELRMSAASHNGHKRQKKETA